MALSDSQQFKTLELNAASTEREGVIPPEVLPQPAPSALGSDSPMNYCRGCRVSLHPRLCTPQRAHSTSAVTTVFTEGEPHTLCTCHWAHVSYVAEGAGSGPRAT